MAGMNEMLIEIGHVLNEEEKRRKMLRGLETRFAEMRDTIRPIKRRIHEAVGMLTKEAKLGLTEKIEET